MIGPFINNNNPFGFPFPGSVVRRRGVRVPTLDQRGVYELCTTGMIENTALEVNTVDYGVNPCIWRALPNECVVVWKVRHPVSQAGADLPVTVVIPSGSGSSTVTSSSANGSSTGKKIPVVDNKSTQAQGHDVTVPVGNTPTGDQVQAGYTTEHWVYINKCNDTFRLMGVTATNSPAVTPVPTDTPAQASAVAKK